MLYSDFFRFLENKDRLIDKLDLTDEQKEELKAFFQKHPNYEGKIDWNNKSLQYKDFEEILALEDKSRNSIKKYGKSGKAQIEDLKEGEDYLIIAEKDNEFAHTIIYYPLTFKASEVLAKPTTPPLGITGQWCIAGRNYSPGTEDKHWLMYTGNGTDFFFVFVNDKNNPTWSAKYAISRTMDGYLNYFSQNDEDLKDLWDNEHDDEDDEFTLSDELEWARQIIQDNKTAPRNIFVERNFYIDSESAIYSKSKRILQKCPPSSLQKNRTYQIPEGTEYIWADAFRGCRYSNIIVPDSVVDIGGGAFSSTDITSITFGKNIKALKNMTFDHCTQLQSISLPDSITKVENWIFSYCTGLQKVKLPKNLKEIDKGMFYYCLNLQEVVWPESLFEIGTEAFAGCKKLTKVVLPNPVYIILSDAFTCSGLEELEITPSQHGCRIAPAFYKTPLKRIIFHGTEETACRSLEEFFSPTERATAYRNQTPYVPWGCELICTEDNKRFVYEKP